MSVTALFGGTFNPFHIGHYEMLKALNSMDSLDRIFVMPDSIPPHKVCDFLASDEARTEMCRIACEDFSKAELCLIEFERMGKSYTYDTVTALKEKYTNEDFCLVCGGDMITSFKTWYRWEELLKLVKIIAFCRSGEEDRFFDEINSLKSSGAEITVMPDKITDISSTRLRADIKSANKKKLIPEKIYKYITEKGIYL